MTDTVTFEAFAFGIKMVFEAKGTYTKGTPDQFYTRNGDPGDPGDPPEFDTNDITLIEVAGTKVDYKLNGGQIQDLMDEHYDKLLAAAAEDEEEPDYGQAEE